MMIVMLFNPYYPNPVTNYHESMFVQSNFPHLDVIDVVSMLVLSMFCEYIDVVRVMIIDVNHSNQILSVWCG